MKRILFVSGAMSIIQKIDKYVNDGLLDRDRVYFAIEFFDKQVSENLPQNCVPVKDFLDQNELDYASQLLLNRGDFSSVIALDESSLYTAADFRRRLGCSGPRKPELEKFRDKVVMKNSLSGSGIRTPRLYNTDDLRKGVHNFPLVAKPRAYYGSIGVRLIQNSMDLAPLLNRKPAKKNLAYDQRFSEFSVEDLQFEEYIEGSIFHIDGLVLNGNVRFVLASKYINSCLGFIGGNPLGSVTVGDPKEQSAWAGFADCVVNTMKVPDGAFHIEAFLTPNGERVFLEIASRLPGALILNTLDLVFGIDLRWLHILCQLGEAPDNFEFRQTPVFGGFLIFPMKYINEGETPSFFVRSVTSLSKSELPTLLWSKYPEIGSPAESEFAYEYNLGGFVFGGHDEPAILKDIFRAIEHYKVEVT